MSGSPPTDPGTPGCERSDDLAPSAWVVTHVAGLAAGARVLDVAAGGGRHTRLLARAGCDVTAIDVDAARMASLASRAEREGWRVTTQVRDLEVAEVDLGDGVFDCIVVTHYLHRPLLPSLVRALAPGGRLVYETFTVGQAARGRPTNRAFLLEDGELVRLVAPLVVEQAREGEVDGCLMASVVARKVSERAAP